MDVFNRLLFRLGGAVIIMMMRIAVVVSAFVSFIAFPVLASPPVPPPVETSRIRTVTDIQCSGTVRESSYYIRQWIGAADGDPGPENVGYAAVPLEGADPNVPIQNVAMEAPGSDVGGPGREPTLGAGDTAGEIRYELEFNAVGGQTAYNKVFDSHSGGTPEDLDVDLTFAFAAPGLNGSLSNGNLSFSERVGMTIVNNGLDVADARGVTGVIGGLCPWVQDPGGSHTEIPASNETVAMGSEIRNSSAVTANTATRVGASVEVPNASYAIAAQGQGYIEAGMAAQIQEGFGQVGWAPSGEPVFVGDLAGLTEDEIEEAYLNPGNYIQPAQVVAPGLALFEQYEESSSASGQWTFSKALAYESQIPVLQIPAGP